MIDFEGGHPSKAIVRSGVVGESDAASEGRPDRVMVIRKETETAIPISSEHLDGAITSRIVTKGGSCLDVGSLSKQGEGFRQELGGGVRVQGARRSKREDDPIQKWLQPGPCFLVGERDHNDIA